MAPGRRGQQGSRPLRADVVVPDESGITPGYEQLEIDQELLKGDLVPMAPAPQPAARTHTRQMHRVGVDLPRQLMTVHAAGSTSGVPAGVMG
jgi:hypothetical protein